MGRDFYDTVFLFGRNKPDFSYLQIKTDISSIEELKTALLNKCEGLNLKELTGDVKPYLLNPLEEKKILLFPDYIRSLR